MKASTNRRGSGDAASATALQSLNNQKKVNDDHLVASRWRVGDTQLGVKNRPTGLRHDRAINLASFTAYVGAGVEEIQHRRRAL